MTSLGVTQIDTIAPGPGDLIGVGLFLGGALVCVSIAVGRTIFANQTSSVFREEEKEVAAEIMTEGSKKRAVFPFNPYAFNPRGLKRKHYVTIGGGKNGGIIKWEMPFTRIAVFEWNEDLKNAAHYHVLLPEWHNTHDGTHFYPGELVPEPWNSLYFGG